MAVLSSSGYSSFEKKSKLESIVLRPSCEGAFVEDKPHRACQEGVPLLMLLVFFGEGLDWVLAWLF